MRRAELAVAVVMAAFSLYTMWKSTELPIGWIPEFGPGGGAFPFWLAVGMLLSSVAIFFQGLLRKTPESQSTAAFMDARTRGRFFTVSLSLMAMVGAIHVVGVYVSVPVFVIFYMRYLGRHSWPLTLSVSMAIPVVTFLFFEKLLLILLPKGVTDEYFYIFF